MIAGIKDARIVKKIPVAAVITIAVGSFKVVNSQSFICGRRSAEAGWARKENSGSFVHGSVAF